MGTALVRAIDDGTLDVHYQRIVDNTSGRVIAVEALARWPEGRPRAVSPSVFVPIAERMGIVRELDMHVLRCAVQQLAVWRDQVLPDLVMAVNLSPVTLGDQTSSAEVCEIVRRFGVPPTAVVIEATETALVGETALQSIEQLSRHGLRIALDDFGTGYSSLAHLLEMPVNEVKIDRSFTARVASDPAAATIVHALVGLGRQLGIEVVAEGVQDAVIERHIRRLGVRLVQGYLLGRPAPACRVLEGVEPERRPAALPVTAAPVPADEQARLAALRSYRVLDTEPDAAFDHLTRLAAEICEAPISLVSLVDESRQWFKSSVGLPVRQTGRAESFCAHAIVNRELFVVEDASQDHRFAGNPLVIGEPHIRFYAGAPLITPDGHALGTFCVIDRHPRRLDPSHATLLRSLAEQVVTNLELRRVATELTEMLRSKQQLEAELRRLAAHDPLTGLANRTGFFTHLESVIADPRTAVLFLDLNGFKLVNDDLGHARGDSVLVEVAQRLRASLRVPDVAARLGGDEFAVVVQVTSPRQLAGIVRRVTEALSRPYALANHNLSLGCSIGAALTRTGDTAAALVARADRSMYEAKRSKDDVGSPSLHRAPACGHAGLVGVPAVPGA
jgi:diguanylate cyclase (GGDEF)-like protein